MKYPETSVQEILAGMLPHLNKTRPELRNVKRFGWALIASGSVVDAKGRQLLHEKEYEVTEMIHIDIDHEKNIRSIIHQCRTNAEVTDKLGTYLGKNGRPLN